MKTKLMVTAMVAAFGLAGTSHAMTETKYKNEQTS